MMPTIVNGKVTYQGGEVMPDLSGTSKTASQTGVPAPMTAPTISVPTPSSIVPEDLGSVTPLVVPRTTESTTSSGINGMASTVLDSTKALVSAQTKKEEEALKAKQASEDEIRKIQTKITGIKEARPAIESEFKIAEKTQKYNDVTTQLEASQRAQENEVRAAVEAAGGTTAGAADAVRAINRKYAFEQADLALIQSAANRDMLTATALADRKVKLTLEPLEEQLSFTKEFYTENKDNLTKEQDRAFQLKIKEDERTYNEAKTKETNLQKTKTDLLASAAGQDAPPEILSSIQSAKTEEEAITAAGQYGGDMLERQIKLAQLQKTRAEAAKILAETKGEGAGGNESDLVAYASQFSDTGKLPNTAELKLSGLSAGQVTAMAKQLPKSEGALVSKSTGVKSSSLSPAQEDGILALYDITKKVEQLKALDDERQKGLLSAATGKVFGSADQQRYLDLRQEIIDLLARARTGAALTVQEEKFYADQLPGRVAQVGVIPGTGYGLFGTNSQVRIDNFSNKLNSTLRTKLDGQGAAIYGYSKVKVGGVDRTVGEVLQIGDQQFRVLPDGSLTDII